MMSDEELVETARRLSLSLTPGDLDHTLGQITAAAVEVLPGVTFASFTILHGDGSLETAAPTDSLIDVLDAAQYRLRQGPCYEAATDSLHVSSADIGADERFPDYGAIAAAAGIKAQAGIRLFDSSKGRGALNLYSPQIGTFESLEMLSKLFAHQAATVISYANEIQTLREAVDTRATIGQAIGILMERYKLDDKRAFAFLARLSQQRNIKLRKLAEEVNKTVDPAGG
jgi:GAF domain-containing protein